MRPREGCAFDMTRGNSVRESRQVMRPHLSRGLETGCYLDQGRLAEGCAKEAHPEWRAEDDPGGDLHNRIAGGRGQT